MNDQLVIHLTTATCPTGNMVILSFQYLKIARFLKKLITRAQILIMGHSMSNHPMVETVPPQILMKICTFGLYGQKRRFAK